MREKKMTTSYKSNVMNCKTTYFRENFTLPNR